MSQSLQPRPQTKARTTPNERKEEVMKVAGQHEPRLFSTRSRSAIAGLCLLAFLPYFSYILLGWERLERMQACVFFAAKPSPSPLRVKFQHSSAISSDSLKTAETMAAKWAQKTVVIPPQKRGCHLITPKILKEVEQDLSGFKCSLAHLFIQHTSASLTINENYDSDVRADTETFLNRIVPEGPSAPWKHTMEGPDDMPAHIKSSMFGCSLTIPITDGRLNMGTWQGIWLCEHRDYATPRKIVVTLNGV